MYSCIIDLLVIQTSLLTVCLEEETSEACLIEKITFMK